MVIWLLGLPGSGKTTLGSKLEKFLKERKISCCMIDGNVVRNFFGNDLGYSIDDRIMNMKRIILSAYFLERNNIIPIICNISPFKYMRNFVRNKFSEYVEIYLKKPFNIASKEPSKFNVYMQNSTPIIGRDIPFEEPENPDLIIETYKETIENSFQKLKNYIIERI